MWVVTIVGAVSGILYVPIERFDDDHVYYPYELLIVRCKEILQVGREVIERVFDTITLNKRIVIEGLNCNCGSFLLGSQGEFLYSPPPKKQVLDHFNAYGGSILNAF